MGVKVTRMAFRKRRDGWTRIAVPETLLHKRYEEIAVKTWNRTLLRQVKRWAPKWPVVIWLSENAGLGNWQMDYRTREIVVKDENVAFAFKLRWA